MRFDPKATRMKIDSNNVMICVFALTGISMLVFSIEDFSDLRPFYAAFHAIGFVGGILTAYAMKRRPESRTYRLIGGLLWSLGMWASIVFHFTKIWSLTTS